MPWNLILQKAFLISLFAAAIRLAIPVLLATLGEIITELSGILNLGLEGIMTIGAFAGFAIAYATGNIWLGLLGSAIAGVLAGILMALLTVTLRIDQVLAGLVLVLLGLGLSDFLYRQVFGVSGKPPRIDPLPPTPLPILSQIPIIGEILFSQSLFVYLILPLAAVMWFIFNQTTWGLKLRASGEVPSALQSAGTSVSKVRYLAIIFGSALVGLGGGFLTTGQLGLYIEGVIAGRGWVSLALVIFARWNPGLALIGAMIFGMADAIQFRLQALGSDLIPYELFLMLPYIITILALLTAGQRLSQPTALGQSYYKEER
jgi:simple sugar transport system permease protein